MIVFLPAGYYILFLKNIVVVLGPGYFLLRWSLLWNFKHLLRESLWHFCTKNWYVNTKDQHELVNRILLLYCLYFPHKRCHKFHRKLFAGKFVVNLLTSLRGNPWHFCAKNWYEGSSKQDTIKITILLQMCHRFLHKIHWKFHCEFHHILENT